MGNGESIPLPCDLGGYRLLERIGAGAMSTVFRAIQVSLDRPVAVKVLNPELAARPDYVERFLREARAVARLNHPNVISGIDVGEHEGLRYFVMEYAEGTTVGALLRRGGAMDPDRAARIALQIARGLEHAAESGLVHRDVKPDNILVTKAGIAKLCDLGLALEGPAEGRSMGTPGYVAPEQARGDEEVDMRADLYALGATLFHMLAGRPPFEGHAQHVLVKHLTEEPPALRDLEPEVPEDLAAIVGKLMRKDPRERFQSPRALIEALEACRAAPRQGPAVFRPTSARRRR